MAPELAVTDGMPPPADLPRGECTCTTLYDEYGQRTGIRIDHADPRILISAEVLELISSGEHLPATSLERDCACSPDLNCPHRIGGLLKIRAVNRTVIYRITEYVARVHAFIGEWPD